MDISSDIRFKVDIQLPTAWEQLTQKQLYDAFAWLSDEMDIDEVKALAFLKWGGMKVIGKGESLGTYLVEKKGVGVFFITPLDLAQAARALDFLKEPPKMPVRLEKIGRKKAADARLRGCTFEDYIYCDNNYIGYIKTQKEELIFRIARRLYRSENIRLDNAQALSIFYWWISLKDWMNKEYKDLFNEHSDNDNLLGDFRNESEKIKESVDTMIRALTKGDVTKEGEILATEVHRALSELNAQAKEYREMKRQLKK